MNATLITGPNCAACKAFLPVIQKVAKRYGFYLQVSDAEKEPELVRKFGIQSIPTTIFYCNGKTNTVVGNVTEERLEKLFKQWGCK